MIDFLISAPALIALLTLTVLGIILSVDNIRFIDIAIDKLDGKNKSNAMNLSFLMAFLLRFALLLIVYWVVSLTAPFWDINLSWFRGGISGESLLLIIGGLFLLYKGTTEIHEEVEDRGYDVRKLTSEQSSIFGKSIWQTTLLNVVFSFDIVLLALGLTNRLDSTTARVIVLVAIAMTLSLLIVIIFKKSLLAIFKKHPSINILGLAILILVGFSMLVEGAYLSHLHLFGSDVGMLSKSFIYGAIIISLLLLFIVIKKRKENIKGELTN